MFVVFWINNVDDVEIACSKKFDTTEMSAALKFSEGLRKLRREGHKISFINMASEHPDCVGEMGVDVTGPEYDWKKRRP